MSAILFHEEKKASWFRDRRSTRSLLLELFAREKVGIDTIQFILTSDDHVLAVNQEFLQHDFYTDIITFDLSLGPKSDKIADIFISIDRVQDNAKTFGGAREEELLRVMIHGCLHLCGYKDKLKGDKVEMRNKGDFYLCRYRKRST